MSVLRPRPPTDPIDHLPPAGVLSADGRADPDWQAWLDRAEAVRGGVASSSTTAAEGLLAAYGTTRSQARRRDSALFGILDVARRIRESVDRVVVIGDRADRALVDLLLGTCCHPCHDDLPRHERGGRPRIWTLGPDDDDDTVQGIRRRPWRRRAVISLARSCSRRRWRGSTSSGSSKGAPRWHAVFGRPRPVPTRSSPWRSWGDG
jgi:hypothetical protein